MEQHQQKSAIILKYAKRRFDGGNECDLIRSIERQQDVEQLNRAYGGSGAFSNANTGFVAPLNLAPHAAPAPAKAAAPVKKDKRTQLLEAAVRGPLQICIGVVGMLTAGLAIVTFRRTQNEAMLQQSNQVFSECLKALQKGVWESFTTPVRVLKVLFTKG